MTTLVETTLDSPRSAFMSTYARVPDESCRTLTVCYLMFAWRESWKTCFVVSGVEVAGMGRMLALILSESTALAFAYLSTLNTS